MRLPLEQIHRKAAQRPPGYAEDVISKGRVEGTTLVLDDDAYLELVRKYRGAPPKAFNYPEPSLLDLARNFSLAVANFVKAGCPVVDELELVHRRETCYGCDKWKPQGLYARCALCGCSKLKLWLRTERCPLGKWKV